MAPNTVSSDVAELHGRFQMAVRRQEIAEEKLAQLEAGMKKSIRWRQALMSALVTNKLPMPSLPDGDTEPLAVLSREGALILSVPDGLVEVCDAAAANDIILRLMEHARRAWPDAFPEVF